MHSSNISLLLKCMDPYQICIRGNFLCVNMNVILDNVVPNSTAMMMDGQSYTRVLFNTLLDVHGLSFCSGLSVKTKSRGMAKNVKQIVNR